MLAEAIDVIRTLWRGGVQSHRGRHYRVEHARIADSVKAFRSAANGNGSSLVQGGLKVCWGEDEADARRTVHRLWANEGLPGELAQVLPTPAHFEQANELVTEDLAVNGTPCGPDVDAHVSAIEAYAEAGFDELYVNQIGRGQDAFFAAYRDRVLPKVR
jgi:alkanesulfonate monooxygenase SsuD/methylene tetrahydromethanopterin reductase-like flavin-dependent oxidoreductase (luciferase family)